jgi:hypothetical protein
MEEVRQHLEDHQTRLSSTLEDHMGSKDSRASTVILVATAKARKSSSEARRAEVDGNEIPQEYDSV